MTNSEKKQKVSQVQGHSDPPNRFPEVLIFFQLGRTILKPSAKFQNDPLLR